MHNWKGKITNITGARYWKNIFVSQVMVTGPRGVFHTVKIPKISVHPTRKSPENTLLLWTSFFEILVIFLWDLPAGQTGTAFTIRFASKPKFPEFLTKKWKAPLGPVQHLIKGTHICRLNYKFGAHCKTSFNQFGSSDQSVSSVRETIDWHRNS